MKTLRKGERGREKGLEGLPNKKAWRVDAKSLSIRFGKVTPASILPHNTNTAALKHRQTISHSFRLTLFIEPPLSTHSFTL
jgi:hypothetical protein